MELYSQTSSAQIWLHNYAVTVLARVLAHYEASLWYPPSLKIRPFTCRTNRSIKLVQCCSPPAFRPFTGSGCAMEDAAIGGLKFI
jgi:hypothetical protein